MTNAEAIKQLQGMVVGAEWLSDYMVEALDMAIAALSAQPERVQSYWRLSDYQNEVDVANGNYSYICAYCNHSDIHAKTAIVPYCWHCGAEMRGEQDE